MRRSYRPPEIDRASALDLVFARARLAGLFGNPREEYPADAEAEATAADGYAAGAPARGSQSAASARRRCSRPPSASMEEVLNLRGDPRADDEYLDAL
jgi:hypothetical protein